MDIDTTYIAPNADAFYDKLNDVAENNDFVLYEKSVNANLLYLDQFENDRWREIFCEGSYNEILFWINFSEINYTLNDISLINPK